MKVDNNLVIKACAGDKNAFSDLYHECYKDLYKMALYTLGNDEIAQDVVADTFVEIWKGISKLREPLSFTPWAFKILNIRCKKEIAYIIKNRNVYNIDDLIESPSELSVSLEETLSESASLAAALSKLEAEERMIVILSVLHGYSNKEISKMLEKPQGTISSKLHRTYAKLRVMLGGKENV